MGQRRRSSTDQSKTSLCVHFFLTIESSSAMKTVHAWACMKDKMVPANFLSKTSRHCCSSKMRLARSNSTYACTKAKCRQKRCIRVHERPSLDKTHLVTSVFQLGCLVELSVVEDNAGKGQIGRKILWRSRGPCQRTKKHLHTSGQKEQKEDGRRCGRVYPHLFQRTLQTFSSWSVKAPSSPLFLLIA